MQDKVKSMTKPERLRLASRACWMLSAFATVLFVQFIMLNQVPDTVQRFGIAIAISLPFQYVLTLIESALFDGTLPPPWAFNWKQGGPLPWIASGAIICLFLDVLLNMGGVGMFLMKIGETGIKEYMDAGALRLIGFGVTILFSVVLATGSELLDEFASYIEQNGKFRQNNIPPQRVRQPERQPEQVEQVARQQERERVEREAEQIPSRQELLRRLDQQGKRNPEVKR